METLLTRVAKTTAAIARAEARIEQLRDAQHEAIREAHAAGESVTLIAQLAGLSRQRVHQIVRAKGEDAR